MTRTHVPDIALNLPLFADDLSDMPPSESRSTPENPLTIALPLDAIVFIQRIQTRCVRSCASGLGWTTVWIETRTIEAHTRPYRLQKGERYVRRSHLTESARQAALVALARRQ